MKVKDFPNWKNVVLNDRVILKVDTNFMSWEQIYALNNLEVVTTTSKKYATSFGFTETEVFEALDEYGYSDRKEEVKQWYDGFTFGCHTDIYNPWSILNFLDKGDKGLVDFLVACHNSLEHCIVVNLVSARFNHNDFLLT